MTKPCRRRGLSTVEYTHVSLFAARFPPASSNNQVKLYTSYNHVLMPGQVFQIFFKSLHNNQTLFQRMYANKIVLFSFK